MASTRQQRMSKLLQEELSSIILREINDPRLGMISITDVELTPDFKIANIYISALGDKEEREKSIAVLVNAAGFLRMTLSKILNLRHTPELRFRLDVSLERASRVYDLLNQIKSEENEDDKGDEHSDS